MMDTNRNKYAFKLEICCSARDRIVVMKIGVEDVLIVGVVVAVVLVVIVVVSKIVGVVVLIVVVVVVIVVVSMIVG